MEIATTEAEEDSSLSVETPEETPEETVPESPEETPVVNSLFQQS